MSESTLGRALEFMREPQDVEVRRDGRWVLASMVGWRQEEGGSCRVMIRIAERGVEKTAWAELSDVRLPEHGNFPRTESIPLRPRLPERTEQATGWTSSILEPAADVEPTRLMTLPPPHYWQTVTSRHGVSPAY